MSQKNTRHITTELAHHIAERRFLQRLTIPKKTLLSLIRNKEFQEGLLGLQNTNNRIRVNQVIDVCRNMLNAICTEPNEGWGMFTYLYACDIIFPEKSFLSRAKIYGDGAMLLLAVLQVVYDEERRSNDFDFFLDFDFPLAHEMTEKDRESSFNRFLKSLKQEYVYEMMRLGAEFTPYKSIEHIAGVHNLAIRTARSLRRAGVTIDLALISGAAAGHDIGKFGCKPGERVPYLHYYYTDRWFSTRNIGDIGHIAANHSTWDLEIENLSVESLVLIYADFRVKQERDEKGAEQTRIYTLDASYDVILQKLDNLDEGKRLRYGFVYTKLHDFEDYMNFLGVDLSGEGDKPMQKQKDIALMTSEEAVEAVTFLGIEHSISLMNRLGSERQFATILEAARGETNWKRLRAYINIFEEYATYLSSDQKIQMLGFLYEMLMHREGDIRRQASWLMGNVILNFNAGYKKELPVDAYPSRGEPTIISLWEKYIGMIVNPDHKLTAQHKSWIGYTLKIVLQSMLHFALPADRADCLKAFLNRYHGAEKMEELTVFVLLDAGLYLPFDECGDEERSGLIVFSQALTGHSALMIRAASLRLLRRLAESIPGKDENKRHIESIAITVDDSDSITLTFLKGRLLRAVGLSDRLQCDAIMKDEVVADIFLDNLKTATPWVIKAVNIKLLLDQIARGRTKDLLHIAAHFSNLIKVSERVVVRHDAGAALLHIVPMLTKDQRNEIAVELAKGLEVGEYEFSKYIPAYLGEFLLWLPPNELDEMIGNLKSLLGSSNDRIVSVALSTVGVMVECYSEYRTRFVETDEMYRQRRERMLGMLLKGLAGYRAAVRQEALLVIGKFLFGSKRLNDHEKRRAFSLCINKILFLIHENPEGELTFFYRAAALSHICRFITDQTLRKGGFHFENRDRIAFFPGTFDPFTLSHKGIIREIRDMGFEVMLSIDEFSWSKKTQPRLIRRKIASISVSDEFHVQIFPDDIPVNIANPDDLRVLRETFKDRDVYVVVGSDVVANASSYKADPSRDSIHNFNHIIFRRCEAAIENIPQCPTGYPEISGDIIELSLPEHLEDISSTRIRENIDRNRDISNLIDPVAQEYIYHNSLYLREPQYKPVFRHRHSGLCTFTNPKFDQIYELCRECSIDYMEAKSICAAILLKGDSIVTANDQDDARTLLGFISYRQLKTSEVFSELQNAELASFVRSKATGKTILITGLFTAAGKNREDSAQQLLTEALSHSLREECTYAIFYPTDGKCAKETIDVFVRQGFEKQPLSNEVGPVYFVDMRAPLVLIQNLETTIKEPLSQNSKVLSSIKTAHRRLQETMSILYPGNLVLSLSASVLHHRLVEMITTINNVSTIPAIPRSLGPYLCVPFGKILRGQAVPNTVTKTLHTDKVFAPDIQSSSIEAYPNYSPLENQVKTIKSFSRPVILVDDLIHAGDRMLRIDPLFRSEGIKVEKVLVGLLSGKGLDLMAIKNLPVESVYYLANLRQWFVESTLYPFIGGDTVRREQPAISGLVPSVNLVLPYATPRSLSDCSRRAIFEFSKCCLTNARDILLALETEYRAQFERNLTLGRLSEGVILPLCPDKGSCMSYDASLAASAYIDNDLEMLMRMQALMN